MTNVAFYINKILLAGLILALGSIIPRCCLNAQEPLVHTQHFTELLKERNLVFTPATEAYCHALPREKDRYHEYELVLRCDEIGLEYYYILPEKSLEPGFLPHIYFPGRLASVAINEDYGWLNVRPLSEEEAMKKYGAAWAVEGSFRPKEDFSERKTGKIQAFYSEEGGLVMVYILFDTEENIPDGNSLRFRSTE